MNMNSQRMKQLTAGCRKLVIGYLVAAYPDRERFFDVLKESARGLDVLELGYPSEKPYLDGHLIQEAHAGADRKAASDPEYWRRIREATDAPVWVMAYREDFVDTGVYRVLAEKRLIDAVVLPDTGHDQLAAIAEELAPFGVDVVRFLNPGMTETEMDSELDGASLVYEQLYEGKTGEANHESHYAGMLAYSRAHSDAACYAGFGISTREKVEEVISAGFDGAIIGTELIRRLNISLKEFGDFIENVHQAVDKA